MHGNPDDRYGKKCQIQNNSPGLRWKLASTAIMQVVHREHDGIEFKVVNELLALDEAYRGYYKEWLRELSLQRLAAAKLFPISQDLRYQSDALCREPQPRNIDAEEVLIGKYQLHYQIILGSNMTMSRGLATIRVNLLSLRREYNKLDQNDPTPFILGDAFHKPIKFFMELAEELFNYFYSHYLKLDCYSRHLDPGDMDSLETYQNMLQPREEFGDYLMHNLSYCQCLRPTPLCPELIKSTPKSSELADAKRRAQLSRCQRRVEKMKKKDEVKDIDSPKIETFELSHLSSRLAQLREYQSVRGQDRTLVQRMIYALSPSLMPANYVSTSASVARTTNIVG
ncbi:hypothetical protein AWZ03_005245 [Drosophila navojoa]|uniref:Uncharacterized protein n=1 Tax=Drosophila navojoa TaxID=7232 RepID=A0A484BJR6_DRONA|nr:uncharacterized protein LOC108653563 [Drosophila navojoa]TDG48290.1 hypothetical protein AWZ03_005245 [Drosophila navojoa]